MMLLSICIPIYQYSVRNLVSRLRAEINKINQDIEIIMIDDDSNDESVVTNKNISEADQMYFLQKNIGRSAIRNSFLQYANGEYLLFLDCDAMPVRADFLHQYVNHLHQNECQVICGGRAFDEQPPPASHYLRWNYGTYRETNEAAIRNADKYHAFISNNFVVKKSLLRQYPFDTRIKGYGHEDTLFGFVLHRNHIPILHIDNATLHQDLESNSSFLLKTAHSAENLIFIKEILGDHSEFSKQITLLRAAQTIDQWYLTKPIRWMYHISKRSIIAHLTQYGKSLKYFDWYKLGTYLECLKTRKKF